MGNSSFLGIVNSQTSDPAPITYYLGRGMLAVIVEHSHRIVTWDQRLSDALPQEMRAHCRVINLQVRCLIVRVTSTAWATRLRYLIPSLLLEFAQYSKEGVELPLDGIQCRVQPSCSSEVIGRA